jgi:chromosome segregation ATPase
MPSLEDATERLQKALQQLEDAAEGRCSSDEALHADLRAAKGDNVRLQSAIEAVSDRLDHAIARVKQLMEA